MKISNFVLCTVLLVFHFTSCSPETDEQPPPTNYFDTTIELQSEAFPLTTADLYNPNHLLVVDSLLFIHDQITEADDLYLFNIDGFCHHFISESGNSCDRKSGA